MPGTGATERQFAWMAGRVPSGYWSAAANRRRYMLWLGRQLGYRRPSDWYAITHSDFVRNRGAGLFDYYNGSPSAAVMDCIRHDWKPWLFRKAPSGLWKDPENRRRYMDWLGRKLGFSRPEDWYQLRQRHLAENHGCTFLQYYNGSPFAVITDYLPEYDWKEWCMHEAPSGFWKQKKNRLRYMEWLEQRLGYTAPEDWYRVTQKDFSKNFGGGLLATRYKSSPIRAVKEYLPKVDREVWRFDNAPKGVWRQTETRRKYMDWLGRLLGYRKPEDWYAIRGIHFKQNKGHQLLKYYDNSAFEVVMNLVSPPQGGWEEWRFFRVPQRFWEKKRNRIRFILWLGRELRYSKPQDWYSVTQRDFERNNGAGLIMHYYGGAPAAALDECFPDYPWLPWLFYRVSNQFWHNKRNRRRYMKWLGEELGYQKQADWYAITCRHLIAHSGGGLLTTHYCGSPAAAVVDCIPGTWNPVKFAVRLKMQKSLFRSVRKLFPGQDIEWNYKHDRIRYPGSNKRMELDIFLPGLALAFEYQGEQHFMPIPGWGGEEKLKLVQERDAFKRRACTKLEILLLEVSYKWDGSTQAISEMLSRLVPKQPALAKYVSSKASGQSREK